MQTDEPLPEETSDDLIEFISIAKTSSLVGACRRTIYNWVDSGDFPKAVKLSAGKIAFVKSEVVDWQRARMDERPA
jgi:prophage regulatory protein